MTVLENEDEIALVQNLFMKKLLEKTDKKGKIFVGYQGGSQQHDASWNEELNFWWIHKKISTRFWNGFGTEELRWNSIHGHILDCEINPPLCGIDRKISGVFAKDEVGKLFLMHRGKIGGGRKGIGKKLFFDNYRGKWILVKDGISISEMALVASFENPRFVAQVANFVKEVKRIKSLIYRIQKSVPSPCNTLILSFSKEFAGKRKLNTISEEIEAECDHGIIVNSLVEQFEKQEINVGNSVEIDLYTVDPRNNPITLFEVKTDTSTTSIYKAIGQLYYCSESIINHNCSLVAVFPKTLKKKTRTVLAKLSINCLLFKWVNDKPRFISFNPKDYV